MFSIAHLLDRAKASAGIDSDYRLAKAIGITHAAISNYRVGKSLPNTRILEQLCALSGDDAGLIVAQVEASRAAEGPVRNMWLSVAARLAGRAKVDILPILFAIALIAASALPARASEALIAKAWNLTSYTSYEVDNSPLLGAYHKILERLRRFRGLLRLSFAFITARN